MIQLVNSQSFSFFQRLLQASKLNCPYESVRSSFQGGTAASVLIIWGFSEQQSSDPSVLLIRRTETVEAHKGQMAFPGGVQDANDVSEVQTALRECHEEVGLPPDQLEVLGVLPQMPTVTGFLVSPVLAWLRCPIESAALVLNSHEIAEAIWVKHSRLIQSYRKESIPYGSVRYPIDVFLEEPYRVWGITGSLLKNLLDRLDQVDRLG